MLLLNLTLVLIFSARVLCFHVELPLLPNKKVPVYLYVWQFRVDINQRLFHHVFRSQCWI